jgi:hypothetical protein
MGHYEPNLLLKIQEEYRSTKSDPSSEEMDLFTVELSPARKKVAPHKGASDSLSLPLSPVASSRLDVTSKTESTVQSHLSLDRSSIQLLSPHALCSPSSHQVQELPMLLEFHAG